MKETRYFMFCVAVHDIGSNMPPMMAFLRILF